MKIKNKLCEFPADNILTWNLCRASDILDYVILIVLIQLLLIHGFSRCVGLRRRKKSHSNLQSQLQSQLQKGFCFIWLCSISFNN